MYEYVATRMSDVATRGRVLIKRTRYSNAERLGSRVESRNQKSLVSPTRVIHRPGSCRPETPVLHGPPAASQRPALCTTAACVGRRVLHRFVRARVDDDRSLGRAHQLRRLPCRSQQEQPCSPHRLLSSSSGLVHGESRVLVFTRSLLLRTKAALRAIDQYSALPSGPLREPSRGFSPRTPPRGVSRSCMPPRTGAGCVFKS